MMSIFFNNQWKDHQISKSLFVAPQFGSYLTMEATSAQKSVEGLLCYYFSTYKSLKAKPKSTPALFMLNSKKLINFLLIQKVHNKNSPQFQVK
jgi:hypothetical protein